MQLVFVVVALIVPAFQSGGFLSAAGTADDCAVLIIQAGNIECRLGKLDYLDDYNPRTCKLQCKGGSLPLPDGVCIGNKVPCTEPVRSTLSKWKQDLEDTKTKLMSEWCRGSQGK
uniref:Putative ixodes 10 kDa peptide protein n=1 Tax=Ixodes ricinus TaxID=34613 RepID=A0A0K8RNU1_IXORI